MKTFSILSVFIGLMAINSQALAACTTYEGHPVCAGERINYNGNTGYVTNAYNGRVDVQWDRGYSNEYRDNRGYYNDNRNYDYRGYEYRGDTNNQRRGPDASGRTPNDSYYDRGSNRYYDYNRNNQYYDRDNYGNRRYDNEYYRP